MGNHTATFTRNYFDSIIDGGIIMNMEDVKQLRKEVGWGFLGTTDGKKVGVRPMGGWGMPPQPSTKSIIGK